MSDEALQRAFQQLRRPHWPVTLDEAMGQPVICGCIRALAAHLTRRDLQATRRHRMPVQPARGPAAALRAPPSCDLKRRAAGDHDD